MTELSESLTAFFVPFIKSHGGWAIFICSLILEDLAITASISLVASSLISPFHAFLANFLGVSLGNILVYGVGWSFNKWTKTRRLIWVRRWRQRFQASSQNVASLVVPILLSRAVPGTRVPIYLAAGYLQFPFGRFCVFTVLATFFWILFALIVGHGLVSLFQGHWVLLLVVFLGLALFFRHWGVAFFSQWFKRRPK